MYISRKKAPNGFTLIELLVVIAIVGLLSSIVLGALSVARSRGSDGAIEQALSGIRKQVEINDHTANVSCYSPTATCDAGTYPNSGIPQPCPAAVVATKPNSIWADQKIIDIIKSALAQGTLNQCSSSAGQTNYAIIFDLSSDPAKAFCTDSTHSVLLTMAGVDNNTDSATINTKLRQKIGGSSCPP